MRLHHIACHLRAPFLSAQGDDDLVLRGPPWRPAPVPSFSAAEQKSGVDTDLIPTADRRKFERDGCIILHEFLGRERLAAVRTAVEEKISEEGERSGWEQASHFASKHVWGRHLRRLCNVFAKGRCFVDLATEPLILAYAQLSMAAPTCPFHLQVFNAHDPMLGSPGGAIHSDRQLFAGSRGHFTVIWALDDMTEANGATRVLPGSHHGGWPLIGNMRDEDPLGMGLPAVDVGDPAEPVDGEVICVCKAGSCVLVHGDCWHGQRNNITNDGRLTLHMAYASTPDTRPTYEMRTSLESTVEGRATLRDLESRGLAQLVPPNHPSWNWEKPQ